MGRGDGGQQRIGGASRREPGTKVTDEQREERMVDGFKFELTTTEWNDTDLISVDVHVELDGERIHLTEFESLDETPSNGELREMLVEHMREQELRQGNGKDPEERGLTTLELDPQVAAAFKPGGFALAKRGGANGPAWSVIALAADSAAAQAQVEADPSLRAVSFRYQVSPGAVLVAEHGEHPELGSTLSIVERYDSLEEAEEGIEEIACPRCGSYNDDGEGYDGYCGNCADELESEGHWD